MAGFNKYQQFVEDLAMQVHDLNSDDLKILLSNTVPDAAADAVLVDAAEITPAPANGYAAIQH